MPRLILAMIVKNEAAVIERCLRSALPFVDGCVIHDTGSTDDTRARIGALASEFDNLILMERTWVDFAKNLNGVLADVRRLYAPGDYAFRLDADMTIDADVRPLLDGVTDAYDVTLREGSTYRLPLVTRVGSNVRYEGKTHECLVGYQSLGSLPLDVRHHGDGGSKADKFERDLQLLTDPRATFYRAQSLQCLGRFAEAAIAYESRLSMGGFDEERFLAMHREGECSRKLGRDDATVACFLRAWNERPHRIEPLVRLADFYREKRLFTLAAFAAEKAVAIAARGPCMDRLFVEQWMWEWGAAFEHSVARWWVGEREAARETWRTLLDKPLTPPYRAAVERNLQLGE